MSITRRDLLRTSGWAAGASLLSTAMAGEPVPPVTPPLPPLLVDVGDYERLAPAHVSPMAWDYISAGAGDEHTVEWNRAAYQRLRLRPRNLIDVSQIDLRVKLLGRELAFPILLAPTAYHRLMHPEGELATVRGAGAAGATMVLSSFATTTLEAVAAEARTPLWFQLYVQRDRVFTRELVLRAAAAGYQALVVTVDSPVSGIRARETRSRFTLPEGMERANLRGLLTAKGAQRAGEETIYSTVQDPTLTWKDIAWLRSLTPLPVLLKGVMNATDAGRAVEEGAAGLIVSNHGGRVLDTVPATIEALPEVVAKVAGRVPVLVDGGIRRGTDVLKAMALGASAVLIGRPYLYGLAVGGAEGVTRVVNILRREFEMAMALTGRTSIGAIDASVIWR